MADAPRVPREPLRGRLAVVRPATVDDAPLLVAWHADPEVARFWDDEIPDLAEVLADLARPEVDPYVVEADGEPVGYLQAWFDDPPDDEETGLDMFLIPSARGRGIGPEAARLLARYLLDDVGRARVIVDPYLWNELAIRAWGRAGFRGIEEREPDEDRRDPWLLMVFEEA
jgi:aminoglycoside 6'-N-acetyltransferase